MTHGQVEALRLSPEAPYKHDEFAVWLHNKIVDAINYELWEFREQKAMTIKSSYAAMAAVMSLPTLKRIG